MKRMTWALGILVAAGMATAVAQPPGGPGGRGGPGGGPGGMRPPAVIEALDADHDHVISADELKNATASLLTLDKNNDGKLTVNEFGPQAGGQAGGRGQGGGQAGGENGRRPQPGTQGGRGPGGGPADGPDGGPPEPNPERFVEHAMEFDANKDGKLSKAELKKFAEEFVKHHPGPGGPDGPGGPGPNNGERPTRPQRPEE